MSFRAGQGLGEKEGNTFTPLLPPSSGYSEQGHGWGEKKDSNNVGIFTF